MAVALNSYSLQWSNTATSEASTHRFVPIRFPCKFDRAVEKYSARRTSAIFWQVRFIGNRVGTNRFVRSVDNCYPNDCVYFLQKLKRDSNEASEKDVWRYIDKKKDKIKREKITRSLLFTMISACTYCLFLSFLSSRRKERRDDRNSRRICSNRSTMLRRPTTVYFYHIKSF